MSELRDNFGFKISPKTWKIALPFLVVFVISIIYYIYVSNREKVLVETFKKEQTLYIQNKKDFQTLMELKKQFFDDFQSLTKKLQSGDLAHLATQIKALSSDENLTEQAEEHFRDLEIELKKLQRQRKKLLDIALQHNGLISTFPNSILLDQRQSLEQEIDE